MPRLPLRTARFAILGAAMFATAVHAADVNVSGLADDGWFSDDTRADGSAPMPETPGTNLVSPSLTDAPENLAGNPDHDDDIRRQISFGNASGPVPAGTHEGAVRLTIAPGVGAGKSQISHRKDDATGHATGDALLDPGFFVRYSWRGDGTTSVTPSFKVGFRTSEFGVTAPATRTGDGAWDKVLIYEPGNLNGGFSDGTWRTEEVSRTSGRWWFFDRTVSGGTIGTPLTLEDMATSTVIYSGSRTIADVYALITDPAAVITSVQLGIGSGNAGGDVQVNQLETSFYRAGDVVSFGEATRLVLAATDVCLSGESLDVEVRLENPNGELITGAQIFLTYDPSRLDFTGFGPGTTDPFDQAPFFTDVDEVAGTITVANGDPAGMFFTDEDAVVVTVSFDPIGQWCGETGLVQFDDDAPASGTLLSSIGGMPVDFSTVDLGAVTSDITPPFVAPVQLLAGSSLVLDGDDAAASQLEVPILVTDDAVIGDGCWRDSTAGGTFIYLPIQAIGRAFTVGEIARISYHTKDETADNFDWFFAIYTSPDGVDDDAWYGRRLTSENLYAQARDETVGSWNEWSTEEDGLNVVTFYDSNQNTGFGFFGGPTLSQVQAPGFNWVDYLPTANDQVIDYASEEVWLISVATGSGWPAAWSGKIDAFTIELTTGESITIDFEAAAPTVSLDGSCTASVSFVTSVTDGCSLDPGSIVVTASSPGATVVVDSVVLTPGGLGSTIVSGTLSVSAATSCTPTVTVTVDAADACGNAATPGSGSIELEDVTPPVVTGCPADIVVGSDAGGCGAVVTWTPPVAIDGCVGPITGTSTHVPGDLFPVGTTTVTYTFDDGCGNIATCSFDVTVSGDTTVVLDVDLGGSFSTTFDRCLELVFAGNDSATVSATVTFVNGSASTTVTVPCGDYDCLTITDPLHSLSRVVNLGVSGTDYVASALAADGNQLVLGNLNGDLFVDILDFGVYVSQFGSTYGGVIDTPCGFTGPHADFDGSGLVDIGDFTFIQVAFLQSGDLGCSTSDSSGMGAVAGNQLGTNRGPVHRISVKELRAQGLGHLARGDLNRDGWLDERDIAAFLGG